MTDELSFTRYAADLAPPWARPGKLGAGFWGLLFGEQSDAILEGAQQTAAVPRVKDDCPLDTLGELALQRSMLPHPYTDFPGRLDAFRAAVRRAFDHRTESQFATAGDDTKGVRGWVAPLLNGAVVRLIMASYSRPAREGVTEATCLLPDTSNEDWSDYRLLLDGVDVLIDGIAETECGESTYCAEGTLCGFAWAAETYQRIRNAIETVSSVMPAHYRMTGVILIQSPGFGDDLVANGLLNALGSGGTGIGGGGISSGAVYWRLI
jgi:hypothetical protein